MKMGIVKFTLFVVLLVGGCALTFATLSYERTLSVSLPIYNNCSMENTAFQVGEELVYKLYYNWNFVWLPAGEVLFEVKETDGEYLLSATGRTYASYEWFFKVRDYYAAAIDKNTLLPNTTTRIVHEGKYQLYDEMTFDQEAKKVVSLRGKTVDVAKPASYDMGSCMHDVLSIVYYVRNIDFENYAGGSEFPVAIFMDKEVWPLKVIYLGREAGVKVRYQGRFNTLKLRPQVIAGEVFNDGAEMNIWATDDLNRIPLLIESDVSVGSVKAVLKSYKGLRHPFSSKIK